MQRGKPQVQARELEDGEDVLCSPILEEFSVLVHPPYKQFTTV